MARLVSFSESGPVMGVNESISIFDALLRLSNASNRLNTHTCHWRRSSPPPSVILLLTVAEIACQRRRVENSATFVEIRTNTPDAFRGTKYFQNDVLWNE
jgi:hypothetical protein